MRTSVRIRGKDRSAPRQAQPLIFQGVGCLARCSRRRNRHHPNSAADFVLMFAKISRKRRRVRLRTTAPPTRREVMKPARTSAFGSAFSNAECKRSATDGGAFRPNALEFESRVSRRDFGKRRRLCIAEILICATAVVSCRVKRTACRG